MIHLDEICEEKGFFEAFGEIDESLDSVFEDKKDSENYWDSIWGVEENDFVFII